MVNVGNCIVVFFVVLVEFSCVILDWVGIIGDVFICFIFFVIVVIRFFVGLICRLFRCFGVLLCKICIWICFNFVSIFFILNGLNEIEFKF